MTRDEFRSEILPFSKQLYLTAFRYLRNREDAEDAVQEIFLKLWNMKEKLREYNTPAALATTMIKNHCLDLLRKKRPELIIDKIDFEPGSGDKSPAVLLEKSESYELINKIIEGLPEAHKDAIRQHDIDGLSYQEISEKSGINITTLRVNLSRARVSVRNQLIKIYNEEGRTGQTA